jgi:pilus assembly protein CpaE
MSTNSKTSVVLVGEGHEISGINAALHAMPDIALERRSGALTNLNGTATRLMSSSDIVIFRADFGEGLDLEAVRALHRTAERTALLVALTDPNLSLAEARRLLQVGVTDVLPWTISSDELRQHLDKWRRPNLPVVYEAPSRRGRIVTVAQARGGLGGSTLAVNLADRLIDRRGLRKTPRNRVVVVDLDLQFGSVANLLDVKESDALYQAAMDGTVPDSTFVSQALTSTRHGLWVLSAPTKFAPLEALTGNQVGALLDALAQEFDHVVVDLPRSLVLWVAAVLERTDRLLMVTDCAVPSVRQARRLLDLYLENNPTLQIEVVMSQEQKPLIRGSHHVEASKLLERPFRHWIPFDPRAARKAADRGMPLSAVGSSPLSKSISALGRDTLAELARNVPAHSRRH